MCGSPSFCVIAGLMRSVHCILGSVVFDLLCEMRSRDSPKLPRFSPAVLDPACTPRTCCTQSLCLACFYSCSCCCDLFCTCCSPHPCSLPLPSFPSKCQAGHTPLRVWAVAMCPPSPAMLETWSVIRRVLGSDVKSRHVALRLIAVDESLFQQ